MPRPHIAVVGGGASGLRAALSLAQAGFSVTLFEKNRHLGGRVFSFATPDFGEVDIGQHVWLKCCTELEALLGDLGVPPKWVYRQDRFALCYKRPGARDFSLRSAPLPWPLHLLPGLLRFPGLSTMDKGRLLYGLGRAWLYSPASLEALDILSFGQWLTQHRQSLGLVASIWRPIVLAVCNMPPEEVSARHALFTFRASLLKSQHAADICFLRKPLSAVFDRLARKTLEAAGVQIITGALVREVLPGIKAKVALNSPGLPSPQTFDRVILALPSSQVCSLLPRGPSWPARPRRGAIGGLLLKFARPVMEDLFFAVLNSPVQMVFNKTTVWERDPALEGGQVIEVVISSADREIRMGAEGVSATLLPELARLLPPVQDTPLLARRLLVHGGATFAVPPGGESRRLPARCPDLCGIYLAGEEIQTGWPSTMESAVRAGALAAQAVLASFS